MRGRLDAKTISHGLYQGRLLISKMVEEKAYHTYAKSFRGKFLIDFDHALYSIKLSDTFEKELAQNAMGGVVASENMIAGCGLVATPS